MDLLFFKSISVKGVYNFFWTQENFLTEISQHQFRTPANLEYTSWIIETSECNVI